MPAQLGALTSETLWRKLDSVMPDWAISEEHARKVVRKMPQFRESANAAHVHGAQGAERQQKRDAKSFA
ncbi:hypothetical protein FQN55_002509, partial [Onygenales sp. PD_40]